MSGRVAGEGVMMGDGPLLALADADEVARWPTGFEEAVFAKYLGELNAMFSACPSAVGASVDLDK